MSLSQVRRLNAAVAIILSKISPVKRYSLINVYTYDFKTFGLVPLGLNSRSKHVKYSTINDEKKYKSKDHLFIYFQNNNSGK